MGTRIIEDYRESKESKYRDKQRPDRKMYIKNNKENTQDNSHLVTKENGTLRRSNLGAWTRCISIVSVTHGVVHVDCGNEASKTELKLRYIIGKTINWKTIKLFQKTSIYNTSQFF